MTMLTILTAWLALSGGVFAGETATEMEQPETPEHQVVAIYFHRTVRCPTCKRIGAMAEEAVAKPDEFRTYVHEGVVRYLKQSKEDAEKQRAESKKSTESTE